MIVCHCNVLAGGQIRGVIRAGAHRPSDTCAACGGRARCGAFAAALRGIIRAGLAAPAEK